jgi:hypothetical protein
MLKELIEYECPNCHAGYGALESRAGMETTCACCKTAFVFLSVCGRGSFP